MPDRRQAARGPPTVSPAQIENPKLSRTAACFSPNSLVLTISQGYATERGASPAWRGFASPGHQRKAVWSCLVIVREKPMPHPVRPSPDAVADSQNPYCSAMILHALAPGHAHRCPLSGDRYTAAGPQAGINRPETDLRAWPVTPRKPGQPVVALLRSAVITLALYLLSCLHRPTTLQMND
jgi:hypothetical protein